MDKEVIKPSVKLRKSNIEHFKWPFIYTSNRKCRDLWCYKKKNDLMAAIKSLQHDTSDIIFSLFKMAFNLFKNSVVLSKFKKNHYLSEILIKLIFSDSVQSHD
jgi:hypothetical protein